MRTYTDSIKILEMIKGKARPGIFLVVACCTKLFYTHGFMRTYLSIYEVVVLQNGKLIIQM